MDAPKGFRPELLAPLLRDLASDGTVAEMTIHGTSMHPTLLDGDRIQLAPATAAETRIGDIVMRTGGAGPIIHRLVGWWPARNGWRLLTKGDNARRLDVPLSPDDLVGRVVARVRGGAVRQLDGVKMRLCGRTRAAASFVEGIIVEVWDRMRRAERRQA